MVATFLPERYRLEQILTRARWFGVGALVFLAILTSSNTWSLWGPTVLLAVGNALVWHFGRQVDTFESQQRLGVAATTLDATTTWAVATLVPPQLTPSIYAIFMVVVAEVSLRYSPPKGFLASSILVVVLAMTMVLHDARGNDPFSMRLYIFWSVLIMLAGTFVSAAIREIYKLRPTSTHTMVILDPSTEDLLTPRERQVLSMITDGQSNARIASALVVERKTVKNHINNIYGKLHLSSRYEAITSVLAQRRHQDQQAILEEDFNA